MKKKIKKVKNKSFLLAKIKTASIICFSILFLELVVLFITYYVREKNLAYIDTINDIYLIDSEYYLASGSSNFRYSKYNKRKTYEYKDSDGHVKNIVLEQAKIVKYDLDMNIIWEKTFSSKYDATFYSAIKVDDGYVAVGSYISKYSQIALNTRDGLIVKYDLDGNILWFKNYQLLGDTEFYKIININDGYIVVGQSIYENMQVGNELGGGIIIKYDLDGNIVAKNNYGGNKSGKFNDIVEVDDGYIVCGKDATNYGILVKFKKDFNRETSDINLISTKIIWNKTYSHTDNLGFLDMSIYDNKIYLASASNVSSLKDDNGNLIYSYDAGLVIYNTDGKYIRRYTFGGNNLDRYNAVLVNNNGIYLVGSSKSNDIDIANFPKNSSQMGIFVKYDFNGNVIDKAYYGGNNTDILSKIIESNDNSYLIVGYSNSKLHFNTSNNKDYMITYYMYNEA